MTMVPRRILGVYGIIALLALSACSMGGLFSSEPRVGITLQASANVNPNPEGQASPIVVRLYELKSLDAFSGEDFFALYDNEKSVLGEQLLAKEEIELKPGETRQIAHEVNPATRFMGVIAAYRDIDHAKWQASFPVGESGKTKTTIRLERLAVSITDD